MSINLTKNKDALVAAWHSVVDDKSSTNWALFGYEGQTNNLKVVGSGNGGLEEMIDSLNSSHIMYAFCRVIDTKTSLPKCLLINWQGEGAPIVRKGTCANHIRDIEKLLKGAHITITARSEDDVEVDSIMEKLARATASAYKFNEPRGENEGNTGPVGTTYRRVIPEQEINATERDQFWQREEMEEKKRLEQERIKCEKERQRLEEEIRTREEKETLLREQKVTAKENSIARQKLAEQRAEEANNLRNQLAASQHYSNDVDDDHRSRSEELRRQRSKETQQLIAQRTINARAVFEQNSAAGQMKSSPVQQQYIPKNSHVEAAKKAIEESQQKDVSHIKVQEETKIVKNKTHNVDNIVTTVSNTSSSPNQVQESKLSEIEESQQSSMTKEVVTENELYSQMDGQYLYFDPNNEGMKARALYDYQAADDTEITFDPGDIITHIDAIDEGWWQGLGPDGTYGLFPANYVEVIDYSTT
ncbi:drebrin-like protein [Apis mellifera caucasica]|uniref:Drebrin-like protein n=1 Tax=Apis mellifera TaxID=7460 RepID=A0A7M7R3S1_APIME|nr:drebrin-like protein [Apis mellifera]KAG6796819.1 drebrin-like protein [Apis mellifera caucasica]|eukprot:XP_393055.5 drebrin-like protein [Apis mellifera]